MIRLVILAALLAAVGCTKTSTKYCALHASEDPESCPASDGGSACKTSDDCAAGTPACDPSAGVCVECVAPDEVTACTGTAAPVCDVNHECRVCRAHAECGLTGVCLPDGSCGSDDNVAYVDGNVSSGGACTLADPCGRFSTAFQTNKPFVFVRNSVDENVSITQPVTILGAPNSRVHNSDNTVIEVALASAGVVAIYDLTIGHTQVRGSEGVVISTSASMVQLQRVRVINHAGGGIRVENGHVTLERSEVVNNNDHGIWIENNGDGFAIRNNFIYFNGDINSGERGGVLIESNVGGKLEFNTIADNQVQSGAANAAGFTCSGNSNSAAGNIVYSNARGSSVMDSDQASGTCMRGNSLLKGVATLAFVAEGAQPDYHLTGASPATVLDVVADCASMTTMDIDGQNRPFNNLCDLGADEYMP